MTTTNDKAERKDVEGRIVRIVAFRMGVFPSDVDASTRIYSCAVSTQGLEVIWLDISQWFDLSIPDADAENIKTVGQAVDYVMGRM